MRSTKARTRSAEPLASTGKFIVEKTYIIDDQTAGLFRMNRRAYIDPECLDAERSRLFGGCWIYVGHESEVPHDGDYRARTVAGPAGGTGARRRRGHSRATQHLHASRRPRIPPEVGQREDISMSLSEWRRAEKGINFQARVGVNTGEVAHTGRPSAASRTSRPSRSTRPWTTAVRLAKRDQQTHRRSPPAPALD
jgi:hypothetical protein